MDEEPEQDISFDLPNHNKIDITYAGKHLEEYQSCLVLSHFKGHQMGGFGGALKQLSIGFGSRLGKTLQHSAGKNSDPELFWKNVCPDKDFKESMADAAYSVYNYRYTYYHSLYVL